MTKTIQPSTMLVIESDPAVAAEICGALYSKGGSFNVECVRRLSEGLARLDKKGIDAVLLDLSLPEYQGIEAFDKLFSAVPDLPIPILAAHGDEVVAQQAVKGGARDYLLPTNLYNLLLPPPPAPRGE